MGTNFKYYKIYKPFGMMSQFSRENNNPTLADLGFAFPKDVYPVGRLDHDSEGLLLLTNDSALNKLLLSPKNMHRRTYWVQVEGEISSEAIAKLCEGVEINLKGVKYKTLPAEVHAIPTPQLPERIPPIRFRLTVPTSWVSITLTEGKNRQVRRMTAAVGFPTLRLVRASIESLMLGEMQPGEVVEILQWDKKSILGSMS